MTEFRYSYGKVYILENATAKRVKVGMTTGYVEERLLDVNRKWQGVSGTCQICGGRRLVDGNGFIPLHTLYVRCKGSETLPFEKDSELAKSYLSELKNSLNELRGIELGSTSRKITTMERRIEQFRAFDQLLGKWKIHTVFHTDQAENVELRSHDVLADHLDETVPIGEVFKCSTQEATIAIESVLTQLSLLDSVRKVVSF